MRSERWECGSVLGQRVRKSHSVIVSTQFTFYLHICFCHSISSTSYTLFNNPIAPDLHTSSTYTLNTIRHGNAGQDHSISIRCVSQNKATFLLDQTKIYCLRETTSDSRHETTVLHTSLGLSTETGSDFPPQWQLDFVFQLQKAAWKLVPLFQVQILFHAYLRFTSPPY